MKTHTHTILYFLCTHEWVLHSEPQVPTSTNWESYLYLGVARGLNGLINISWLAWFMSSNLQIVTINRASFKHAKVVRSDSSAVPNGVGRPPGRGLLLLQEWWGPQYFENLKVNNPSFLFLGLHVAWRLFFSNENVQSLTCSSLSLDDRRKHQLSPAPLPRAHCGRLSTLTRTSHPGFWVRTQGDQSQFQEAKGGGAWQKMPLGRRNLGGVELGLMASFISVTFKILYF